MKTKIEFQYRPLDQSRPLDEVQDNRIEVEGDAMLLIPNVGDAVFYSYGGTGRVFKVESRTFTYFAPTNLGSVTWCCVNIVVTDISEEEIAARLKM